MNSETKQIKQGQLFLQEVMHDTCMTADEFNVAIDKLKEEIKNNKTKLNTTLLLKIYNFVFGKLIETHADKIILK